VKYCTCMFNIACHKRITAIQESRLKIELLIRVVRQRYLAKRGPHAARMPPGEQPGSDHYLHHYLFKSSKKSVIYLSCSRRNVIMHDGCRQVSVRLQCAGKATPTS
jgi:hypothetical protein